VQDGEGPDFEVWCGVIEGHDRNVGRRQVVRARMNVVGRFWRISVYEDAAVFVSGAAWRRKELSSVAVPYVGSPGLPPSLQTPSHTTNVTLARVISARSRFLIQNMPTVY
jgi:hypothetical protein